MTSDDGLFAAPVPEHPDAAVAREEITRYYTDQIEDARAELAKAQAVVDKAAGELAAWTERGEITERSPMPDLDIAAVMIFAHSQSAHMKAMRAAIPELGGTYTPERHTAANRAENRAVALRRWLIAQGYKLGEAADASSTRGGRRRG